MGGMGGHPERQKPKSKNVRKLIKNIGLNKKYQIIKEVASNLEIKTIFFIFNN